MHIFPFSPHNAVQCYAIPIVVIFFIQCVKWQPWSCSNGCRCDAAHTPSPTREPPPVASLVLVQSNGTGSSKGALLAWEGARQIERAGFPVIWALGRERERAGFPVTWVLGRDRERGRDFRQK